MKNDQWKRFMVHLWVVLNRPDTDTYENPPKASKTCYKEEKRKKWDAGVHLLPVFRLITHEPAWTSTTLAHLGQPPLGPSSENLNIPY